MFGSVAAVAEDAVRVTEMLRADEWRLADGRVVRLASVVVPEAPKTVEPAARQLMLGFSAERQLVVSGGASTDRYGRLLATVLDDRGEDVRVILLRAGLAVVRVGDEPAEEVQRLFLEEQIGRAAGRGVWGELDQAAVMPAAVADRIGRFALVEGVVVSVTPRWAATFLDFGTDWRSDFTIRIRKEDLADFSAAGVDLTGLAGRKVVARGWPFEAFGPMLEVRDPLELQPVP